MKINGQDFDLTSIKGYSTEVQKLTGYIAQLHNEEEEVANVQLNKSPVTQIVNEIQKVKPQIKGFVGNIDNYINNDVNTTGLREKIQSAIEAIKQKIQSLKGENTDLNFTGTKKQLELVKYKISEIQEKLQQAKTGEIHMNMQEIIKAEAELEKLNNQKAKLEQNSGGSYFSSIVSRIRSAKNGISQAVKSTSLWKNGFNQINKVSVSIKNRIKQMGTGMKSGLKQVLKYAGALFSLRSIYSTLSSSASSWLSSQNSLAQQLSTNIDYMKYAMGSAFAPIIEYVINLVYKLMKALQSVIYALTKVNIFASASASSYSDMADSASDASKATKALSGVHSEINNVNSSDSSSSSSSSPSFDLSGVDTFSSLLDAIENGNWHEVGEAIGQKINDALDSINWTSIQSKAQIIVINIGNFINGFVDGLDWSLLGSTIGNGIKTGLTFVNTLLTTTDFENIGSSIATFLNSAIDTACGDGELGKTIGNAIESAIDLAYGFISTIDVSDIADTLMLNINTAISKIDTSKLGTTVAKLMTTIPTFIISAIQNIDWGQVATKISDSLVSAINELSDWLQDVDWQQVGEDLYDDIEELIENIDWSALATSIFTLLGSALGSLVGMLAGFIGTAISDAFTGIETYFQEKIEECGGDVVAGILKGILDAIVGIGQWIYDNIFSQFIEGFKSAFGINSPSTVMAEMGGYIVDGLKNGLSNIWENVSSIFTDLVDNIKGKFEDIKNGISEKVENIKSNLSTKWDNIKQTASEKWQSIKENVTTKFSNAKETLVTTAQNIGSKISEKWNNIKDTASTKWSNIKDTLTTKFGNTKDTLTTTAGNIGTNLSTKFDSIKSNATSWGSNISSNLSSGLNGKLSTVTSAIGSITSNLGNMNIASSALTWGKDLITNLSNGIKNNIYKVTSAVSSVASKIKSFLGFSEPDVGPLSNFHTYMPDMIDLMTEGIHGNIDKVTEELENLTGTMSYTLNTDDIASNFSPSSFTNESVDSSNIQTQNNLEETFDRVLSKHEGNNDNTQSIYLTVNVGDEKLGTILIDNLRTMKRRSGKGIEALIG